MRTLAGDKAFAVFLAPLKRTKWFVYSKRLFAGPKAVLAYLSRYTHRVAISNRRLIAADANSVTFKCQGLPHRRIWPLHHHDAAIRPSSSAASCMHVLPKGFHRIRHYGLLATALPKPQMVAKRSRTPCGAPQPRTGGRYPGRCDGARAPAVAPAAAAAWLVIETFAPRLPANLPADAPRADHQDRHRHEQAIVLFDRNPCFIAGSSRDRLR